MRLATGLMVLGILVWVCGARIWAWNSSKQKLLFDKTSVIMVRVTQPVEQLEFGCGLEWRGFRVRFDKRKCEFGRIMELTAGDRLTLEVGINARSSRPELEVRQVVEIDRIKARPILSLYWWQQQIWQWRERLVLGLERALPMSEAALVAGILLGVKQNLPEDFYQALINTGTMHVVAASGYNISVISGMVVRLLLVFVRRRWAAIGGLVFVWVYVVLAGAEPPVVRAGIMGSLMLISWTLGRENWALYGYLLSGWLMLVLWPWLWESISFQLSMAATAGVIWVSGLLRRMGAGISAWAEKKQLVLVIWDNFLTTLAATISVLPLSLIHFGKVSALGLLVNPLVLGLVPVIMYLGLAFVLVVVVCPGIAWLLSWVIYPICWLWIQVVLWFGEVEGGMVTAEVNWGWAVGWWLLWLGLVLANNRSRTV